MTAGCRQGFVSTIAVVALALGGFAFAGTAAASGPTGFPGPVALPQPAAGTPGYLQQAYGLTALSQAPITDTVAIVDTGNDLNAESDLLAYRTDYGLPVCPTAGDASCFFTKVDEHGGTTYPAQVPNIYNPGTGLYDINPNIANNNEISIDLDAVSALCPNCHILLVEATPNSDGSGNSGTVQIAQATAGATAGVKQISDSWGTAFRTPPAGVPGGPAGTDPYVFTGIMTVAGSGDFGYWGDTQPSCAATPNTTCSEYPAADPNVTAAGATTLTAAGNDRGFVEAPWNQTGSGCDFLVSQPSWQTTLMDPSSLTWGCTGRAYSDLSADGDDTTGLHVYNSSNPLNSGWMMGGGTSQAAPLIAAYYAVVGATGNSPSWAYAHASLFNAVATTATAGGTTVTNNGYCSGSLAFLCNFGPGYDGPTGLGTISGDAVAGAPSAANPASVEGPILDTNDNFLSATLTGATVYPNAGTTFPVGHAVDGPYMLATGASTGYYWEYGPGAATTTSSPLGWLSSETSASAYTQTSTGGTLVSSTSPVLSVPDDTLTGLYPNTPYHYRLVAYNGSGAVGYGPDSAVPAVATPSAVTATTTAVSAGTTTATLTGTVNPKCLPTTYTFAYGPDYGTTTAATSLPDTSCTAGTTGNSAVVVSQVISGLQSDTTYNYELTADNADNGVSSPTTVYGSFTTWGAPTITITPIASSTSTTVNINYFVSGPISTLTCTLDNSPALPCTSYPTVTLQGLSVGQHTFSVQAAGPSGVFGSDSKTWTVNSTPPPTVAITSPMPSTTGASVTVTYSESGSITGTTCTLNSVVVGCSGSGAALTGLTNGSYYTFVVTANGPGGSSAPASYSFKAVIPPPRSCTNGSTGSYPACPLAKLATVTFTAAPPTSSSATTAKFSYTTTNAVGSPTCTLNGKPVACGAGSATLSRLTPRSYAFVVTVVNSAGVIAYAYYPSAPPYNTFTVTKGGVRTVTITDPKPVLNYVGTSATFNITTTGSNTGSTCKLTNGASTISHSCSGKSVTTKFENLEVGSHTFTVAVKGVNGAAATAVYTFYTLPLPNNIAFTRLPKSAYTRTSLTIAYQIPRKYINGSAHPTCTVNGATVASCSQTQVRLINLKAANHTLVVTYENKVQGIDHFTTTK